MNVSSIATQRIQSKQLIAEFCLLAITFLFSRSALTQDERAKKDGDEDMLKFGQGDDRYAITGIPATK
jgi:hypothetical protein